MEEKELSHVDPFSLGKSETPESDGKQECLGYLMLCEGPDTKAEEEKTNF